MSGRNFRHDDFAIFFSRFIATWKFIILLNIGIIFWIFFKHLEDGADLDVFNLFISSFTLFIDLIILKAAISLRDMDREKMDMMHGMVQNIINIVNHVENLVQKISRMEEVSAIREERIITILENKKSK